MDKPSAYEQLQRQYDALQVEHESLQRTLDEMNRVMCEDRWHATYNAALQSYSLYELGEEQMHTRCSAYATRIHGPLKSAGEV